MVALRAMRARENLWYTCGRMQEKTFTFLRAVGMMVGSIVGVGVFGLPYAFAKAGVPLGLLILLVLAAILTGVQLMFAEVVMQTPGKHRLVGYVREYLGNRWARLAALALAVSCWGVMVAYLITGGTFVSGLMRPWVELSPFVGSMIVAVIVAAATYGGIREMSRVEIGLIGSLLFLFCFMILASLPHVELRHLTVSHPDRWLLPYGVVLFALSGLGIVPELKDVLGKRQLPKLPAAVMYAMASVTVLYAAFSVAVVGVTGTRTTQTAFEGLLPSLGPSFGFVAGLVGSVTVVSVFAMMALQMENMLRYDFGLPRRLAWACTIGVPLLLFLTGMREFIPLIGFIGSVFGGVIGVVVVMTYERMRRSPVCQRHQCLEVPSFVSWGIAFVFLLGLVSEVVYSL